MKIQDGFLMRKIGARWLVVPVGQQSANFDQMIQLNKTSAYLWELLQEDRTVSQLVEAVLGRFDVDEAAASNDVHAFVGQLQHHGILEIAG